MPSSFRIFKRLGELLDVSTLSLATGDLIVYNAATEEWENVTSTGSGSIVRLNGDNAFTGNNTITISSGIGLTINSSGGSADAAKFIAPAGFASLYCVNNGVDSLILTDNLSLGVPLNLMHGTSVTTASGELAFDTNAWGTNRGAIQINDGTANTYVVATLASDTPTNGQVPTWNTGGTVTWETPATVGDVFLAGNNAFTGNNTFTTSTTSAAIAVEVAHEPSFGISVHTAVSTFNGSLLSLSDTTYGTVLSVAGDGSGGYAANFGATPIIGTGAVSMGLLAASFNFSTGSALTLDGTSSTSTDPLSVFTNSQTGPAIQVTTTNVAGSGIFVDAPAAFSGILFRLTVDGEPMIAFEGDGAGNGTATFGCPIDMGGNPITNSSLSGNATTATTLATARAIYGNNFDGSAALTQIIASTYGGTGNGFTKFSGPTTSEKTFTLPDSSQTLLYAGGALGTPSSGTLTNCTQITLGTEQASTSGTSITFTGIPATARRITIHFVGVSTNGTSGMLVRIGPSGGVETTGYSSNATTLSTAATTANSSAGFLISGNGMVAASAISGKMVLDMENASAFTWTASHSINRDTTAVYVGGGSKSAASAIDRVAITMVNGTDAFDGGVINITYE